MITSKAAKIDVNMVEYHLSFIRDHFEVSSKILKLGKKLILALKSDLISNRKLAQQFIIEAVLSTHDSNLHNFILLLIQEIESFHISNPNHIEKIYSVLLTLSKILEKYNFDYKSYPSSFLLILYNIILNSKAFHKDELTSIFSLCSKFIGYQLPNQTFSKITFPKNFFENLFFYLPSKLEYFHFHILYHFFDSKYENKDFWYRFSTKCFPIVYISFHLSNRHQKFLMKRFYDLDLSLQQKLFQILQDLSQSDDIMLNDLIPNSLQYLKTLLEQKPK